MPKRYTSRDLIKIVEKDGWYEVSQQGSHKQFKHRTKPGRVTIVHPERNMHPKTARSVLKQAGLVKEK